MRGKCEGRGGGRGEEEGLRREEGEGGGRGGPEMERREH